MDKPRVLIVDDSKVVRATVAKVIKTSFDTREAADGEEGWEAIEKDMGIVAVISDLGMPRLDGIGLLQRIRSATSPRIRDLPFLVISGNEDDATRSRARAAGANDFISKSTKGVEAVARIDNLLRLVQAKHDLEASHQAIKVDDDDQMWDRSTGAFTAGYLMTEGAKHFSHARRHGTILSAVSFRIENHAEIAAKFGKPLASQLLKSIVKLVQGTLRAEDSMGRTEEAMFSVFLPSTAAEQAIAFAQRLRQRLDAARITHGTEAIRVRTSIGVAALGHDNAASVEDLLKATLRRLERSAAKASDDFSTTIQRQAAPELAATGQRPARPDLASTGQRPVPNPAEFGQTLQRAAQNDVALAVQILERASVERASEVLDKIGPLLKANCARVGIELQEYLFLLQSK